MKKKNYIYIDDEKDNLVDTVVDGINNQGLINLIYVETMTFKDLVDYINTKVDGIDGILFDLVLDGKANSRNQRAEYTAPVAAQLIRTLVTDNKIKDLPIVLCSTDDRIDTIYSKELAGHNLFDMRFKKTDTECFEQISKQLYSLSTGYEIINNSKNVNEIMNFNISVLDDRIFSKLLPIDKISIHDKAQFILKNIIFTTGPLINEYILAARLGIDIERSSDWEKFKDDFFVSAKFTGVFHEGWDRWWMTEVDDIFYKYTGSYLSYYNATERVKLIKEKICDYNLVEATVIDSFCKSNRFWTICEFSKKPLDSMDGFRLNKEIQAWQEYEYISPLNAMKGKYTRMKKSIHPTDINRLDDLRKEEIK